MSKHHKFNQSEYVAHPELYNFITNGWKYIFSTHMFFYLVIVLIHDYSWLLATMDVTITVSLLLFWLFLRPAILRGLIPAFYRKSYDEMKFTYFFGSFVFHGAILRTAVLALFYIATFMITKHDPIQTHHYIVKLQQSLTSRDGMVLGVLIGLYFLFRYFYSDTFISIREYSNRVVKMMREKGANVEFSSDQVMKKRQIELEKKGIQDVKYDKEEVSHYSSVNNNRQTSNQDEVQLQHNTFERTNFERTSGDTVAYAQEEKFFSTTAVPIRRQARRKD
jgi:hypothetical protein